jgi:hypothetical protein
MVPNRGVFLSDYCAVSCTAAPTLTTFSHPLTHSHSRNHLRFCTRCGWHEALLSHHKDEDGEAVATNKSLLLITVNKKEYYENEGPDLCEIFKVSRPDSDHDWSFKATAGEAHSSVSQWWLESSPRTSPLRVHHYGFPVNGRDPSTGSSSYVASHAIVCYSRKGVGVQGVGPLLHHRATKEDPNRRGLLSGSHQAVRGPVSTALSEAI